jgi:hypothetical protein
VSGSTGGILKQIRSYLVTAVIGVVCLRIVLWAIAPLIPYMVSGIILLSVLAYIFSIMWRRSSKL